MPFRRAVIRIIRYSNNVKNTARKTALLSERKFSGASGEVDVQNLDKKKAIF